jgi:hypothetical protein
MFFPGRAQEGGLLGICFLAGELAGAVEGIGEGRKGAAGEEGRGVALKRAKEESVDDASRTAATGGLSWEITGRERSLPSRAAKNFFGSGYLVALQAWSGIFEDHRTGDTRRRSSSYGEAGKVTGGVDFGTLWIIELDLGKIAFERAEV